MENLKPPKYEDTLKPPTYEDALKPPSYKDTLKPPSYEETIAAGPSSSNAAINQAYVADEVVQQVPSTPPIGTQQSERTPILTIVRLGDEELRDALYWHTVEFCCYGNRFIRQMILTDIYNDSAFHYKLETFTEKRESVSKITSYFGQIIDGPENGSAPDLWDVPVSVPTKFVDNSISKEIPHTAWVKICSACYGNKKVTCSFCNGRGRRRCNGCTGSDCRKCGGRGLKSCWRCSDSGRVNCSVCDGHGKLKRYKMLMVTWKNHVESFVSNKESIPTELIVETPGRELFKEQDDRVLPVTTALDESINEASSILLGKHDSSFGNELIIAQRHTLRAVPFTKATYVWREKKGEFYVYGFDKKVYFVDYPQQCCCCVCC